MPETTWRATVDDGEIVALAVDTGQQDDTALHDFTEQITVDAPDISAALAAVQDFLAGEEQRADDFADRAAAALAGSSQAQARARANWGKR